MNQPPVLSVSQITQQVRSALQSQFRNVWVAGEISDLARPRSGHLYLVLKDEQAQLQAVIWRSVAERLALPLSDGLHVCCQGDLDVYPARGSYQLVIRRLEALGEGALQRALRQLRARLAAEGLFDPAHKQPLPAFPRRVAIITSPTAAALHDFLEVAQRRWAGPELLVIPTPVQGEGSVEQIVRAIRVAHALIPRPDVLVLTRGGGSIEDLWSFNDERVVRAIFAAEIPLVSAIGHEIDVTLADLVADVRALTPSEAAERVIPSAEELRAQLQHGSARLASLLRMRLRDSRSRLAALAARPVLARPVDRLRDQAKHLDELERRLHRELRQVLERCRRKAEHCAAHLHSLSPLHVLARGYSVTIRADSGECLTAWQQVQPSEEIITRLATGRVWSIVRRCEE